MISTNYYTCVVCIVSMDIMDMAYARNMHIMILWILLSY